MNSQQNLVPEINIEQIMTEIRARVAEKMKNPEYAADVARFEKEQKIFSASDDAGADGEFLENNYDVDQARPLFSHRPLVGKIIVNFKKTLYRMVHDVFDLTIQNQVIYNFFVAKSHKTLITKINSLETRVKLLESMINSFKHSKN